MKSLSCCVQIFIVILFIVVTSISLKIYFCIILGFKNMWKCYLVWHVLVAYLFLFFNSVFVQCLERLAATMSRMAVLKIHTLRYNGAPSCLVFFLTTGSSLLSKIIKWPKGVLEKPSVSVSFLHLFPQKQLRCVYSIYFKMGKNEYYIKIRHINVSD